MGRDCRKVVKTLPYKDARDAETREVELFTWEKLDRVEDIKAAFGLA